MLFKEKNLLNIVITLNCDSSCKHCYINSVSDNSSKDLSVDTWKQVFFKFKEAGGKEISIHGGEPLLYKGIKELLIYSNKIGLSTSIISNTLHLDDKLIRTLVETNTYVLVSFDGPKDNYKILRGADKYNIIQDNVKKMIDAGITVHPITVIHNHNIDNLSWLTDYVQKMGIKTVTLSPIQPMGRAVKNSYRISHSNIEKLVHIISDFNSAYDGLVKFVTQPLYTPNSINDYIKNKENLLKYNSDIINVLNDGRVVADLDLPNRDDFILGSVLDPLNVNEDNVNNYNRLLEKAYKSGHEMIENGNSINFFEVLQKEALKYF